MLLKHDFSIRTLRQTVSLTAALLPAERLVFREVSDEVMLKRFQHEYWRQDGVCFPLEYLRAGRAYLVFAGHEEVVGGFFLGFSGIRVLEQIPSASRDRFLRDLKPDEVPVEFTAVWLKRGRRHRMRATQFWLRMLDELASLPNSVAVFSCDLRKSGLVRMYLDAASSIVYCGPIVALAGMADNGADEEIVFCMRAKDLAASIGRQALIRLFRSSRRTTHKTYTTHTTHTTQKH